MQTRTKNGIFKPKSYDATVVREDLDLLQQELAIVKQALSSLHWKKATEEEFTAFMKNSTWSPMPLPKDRKPIGCKWVFRVKRNLDGSIQKYKAKLVTKGFHQKEGVDFLKSSILWLNLPLLGWFSQLLSPRVG